MGSSSGSAITFGIVGFNAGNGTTSQLLIGGGATTSPPTWTGTLPTTVQTNITQLGSQSQALDMNSHQINNVSDPTSNQDAVTKFYLTSNYSTTTTSNSTYLKIASNLSDLNSVSSARTNLGLTNIATQSVTQYDVLLGDASNGIVSLTNGASGTVLQSNGTSANPSWISTLSSTVQLNITQVGILTSGTWNGTTIAVANGGTGTTSVNAYGILIGGTTSTGAFQSITAGVIDQILLSGGSGAIEYNTIGHNINRNMEWNISRCSIWWNWENSINSKCVIGWKWYISNSVTHKFINCWNHINVCWIIDTATMVNGNIPNSNGYKPIIIFKRCKHCCRTSS